MALQTNFDARSQPFFVGFPTMPFADCFTRRGRILVPTSGTAPKPGDAVIWDATNKSFRLPTTAAEAARLDGIIVLSQQTTGVTYANNDPIIVMQRGTLAVIAGGTVGYRDIVQWQFNDQKWNSYTLATASNTKANIDIALNVESKILCASYDGAVDNGIMEISINLI